MVNANKTNQIQNVNPSAVGIESTIKCPSGLRPKVVCPEIVKTPTEWLKLTPAERQKVTAQKVKELCNWHCLPLPIIQVTVKPKVSPQPTLSLRPTVTIIPNPKACPAIVCPLNCLARSEPLLGNCPICSCEQAVNQ